MTAGRRRRWAAQTDEACSGQTFVQSFRGSAAGREPGIHNHRSRSMDSGLASASLRRPGMTRLTEVDTLAPRVLTQAVVERDRATTGPTIARRAYGFSPIVENK